MGCLAREICTFEALGGTGYYKLQFLSVHGRCQFVGQGMDPISINIFNGLRKGRMAWTAAR